MVIFLKKQFICLNVLIIFITIILSSCECRKRELSNLDKQWVEPYTLGQCIIFKSSLNNFDTFKVAAIREFYTDCNRIEKSEFQNNIISIELIPNNCPDKNYCRVSLEIQKDDESEAILPFIRVFTLEYAPSIQKKKLKTTQLKLSTTKKQYNSAFIFSSGDLTDSFGSHYLINFYWDKEDGLISYTTSKNEVFELLSKSSVN
ncbi:MAG: hypothetical protein JNL70_20035 [Saprospiraceae bacterium]|nr:hypothetical protein [Saprospiraceae bacterium]